MSIQPSEHSVVYMYMILDATPGSLLGKTGRLHPRHYYNLAASPSSTLLYFFYFYFNIMCMGALLDT